MKKGLKIFMCHLYQKALNNYNVLYLIVFERLNLFHLNSVVSYYIAKHYIGYVLLIFCVRLENANYKLFMHFSFHLLIHTMCPKLYI